jgi:hypothetical protein
MSTLGGVRGGNREEPPYSILPVRRAGDIAEPRRQRREDRIEMVDGFVWAADHHAIAAFDAPDAAGGAAVDIANAPLGQFFGAADVVLVEAITAVDDDVVRLQQTAQTLDGFVGGPTGRQHQPNSTRPFSKLLHHIRKRYGS